MKSQSTEIEFPNKQKDSALKFLGGVETDTITVEINLH